MSGRRSNRVGPGWIPQITIEPSMIAITESPGIPSDKVVVSAPPRVELEAVSEPTRPSMVPLPKSSGCFEIALARFHPIRPAMSPPAAGTIPITTPIRPDRLIGLMIWRSSPRFGHHRPSELIGRTRWAWWVMIWSRTSVIPKRPMIKAMKSRPPVSSWLPKVNRSSAVIGSNPIVARARPSSPEQIPLATDRDAIEMMIVRPKTTKANISYGPKRSASRAIGWARKMKTTIDSRIPTVVAIAEIDNASPACPFLAIG